MIVTAVGNDFLMLDDGLLIKNQRILCSQRDIFMRSNRRLKSKLLVILSEFIYLVYATYIILAFTNCIIGDSLSYLPRMTCGYI